MGGCSSKPQTAECHEGLLFPTGLKTSDSSAHQTLGSLFHQHGRDGEDLLGDPQTLHELLLHAVESKDLPDFENQSTGNTESTLQTRALQPDLSASPCKLNSPVSVLISHAAEKDSSECINVEGGTLLNLAESNAVKLESSVSTPVVTEEIAEKCTQTKGSMSDLAEENSAESGDLEAAADEKCGKLEVTLVDLPEESLIRGVNGFMSNVAEENPENTGKSKGFVSNLAEIKLQEECVLSKFAAENAIKLESGSSPGSLNLELKSELLKNPESAPSECKDYETRGLNLGSRSDSLKISEANLLHCHPTDVVEKIKAPTAMQGLNKIAMQSVIERGVQDELTVETDKTPEQDAKCEKNKKPLQDEESKEQSEKAMAGEEMEKTVEDKKTEMQCAMALGIEKDEISDEGEKAELRNKKAMVGAAPKVQFESGWILSEQGDKATKENLSPEKTEEAMECEKQDVQDEKALEGRKAGLQDEKTMREDEKTGVQNERAFDVEVEKLHRDEHEKAVHIEKLVDAQDKETIAVQDDKTRLQTKKIGLDSTETQHEERAKDDKATAITSALHVKAQHEKATADAPSSPGNQSFADCTHTKHDFCFEPSTGSEQSIVAMGSGPISESASKENTIKAAELGLIETLDECNQKNFTCKDNMADVVATEKLEVNQKKLVSYENIIEAVGPEECSIEAVAGSELTKLCNTVRALDDGQRRAPDSEGILCIERHGKLEHDTVGASQHGEADELGDKKNVSASVLEESLIEAAIMNSDNSIVVGEKGDDNCASELNAKEEKKVIEPLEEQSMHEVNAKAESIKIECPSKLVVENDNDDDSDEKVKMEMSAEEHGFIHNAEKLHIQMLIQEGGGSAEDNKSQEHNGSALCSFPESSVPEISLSSPPTVVDEDVEKLVIDITSSSSLSAAAEKSCMECVESKPKQKPTGEVIDDANEDPKQCGEKGEGLKPTE